MHWLNIKQKKIKIEKYEMIFSWKAESWIGHRGAFFLPTNSFHKFSYMERNPLFQAKHFVIHSKKKYKRDDFRMKQTKRWSLILINEIMQFLTTRDFLTHQNCIAASLRRRYNTYTDQKCMAWCEDYFILCKIEFERDESAWKFDR